MQSKSGGKIIHPAQSIQNPINLDNIKTISLADLQGKPPQQQNSQGRKEQSLWIYFSILLATISMSADNLPFFLFPGNKDLIFALQLSLFLPKLIALISSIWQLSTCRQFITYLLLLDNITVTGNSSLIVVIMLSIFIAQEDSDYIIIPVFFVLHSLYCANFRIMMVFCKWKEWQVIVYKLLLLFNCLFFMFAGCFVLLTNLKYTNGENPEKDQTFFNFVVVYLAALFAFYFEMFSKVTDLDGTNNFTNRYILMNQGEESNGKQSVQNQQEPRRLKQGFANSSLDQFSNRNKLKNDKNAQ